MERDCEVWRETVRYGERLMDRERLGCMQRDCDLCRETLRYAERL